MNRSKLVVASVGGLLAAVCLAVSGVYALRAVSEPPTPIPGPGRPAPKSVRPSVAVSASVPKLATPPVFMDVAAQAGLKVAHFDAADGRFRLVESMGGGVGVIDFDGDGWPDLFVCQGSTIPHDPNDRTYASQLYRNNRDGTFTDVASRAGVSFPGFAQGVAVGDVDRDGDDDLYVSGFDAAALFVNNGDGTFTDVTARAGLTGRGWSTSCAFADLDADGDLDLYVVRYLEGTVDAQGRPTVNCNALPGQIGYCPPTAFAPAPDSLYRNNGDGTFTDVAAEAGIAAAGGNGLGLAIGDFDDDGRLDVFVANDKSPNLMFRNLGGLRFEEVGLTWGVAYNESGDAQAGMGVAAGDHDGDGRTDLLVTNFYEEGATLYRNAEPGRFEVATGRARLRLPTRSKLGFGTGFFDYDNDGRLDLFIANGHINDVRPLRMPYRMPPQLFHNAGAGRFDDVSTLAGPAFSTPVLGRGTAFADVDNDGDTDVVVTHNDAPPAVLRNDTKGGQALRLVLAARSPSGGRDRVPVGARVTVRRGEFSAVREVVAGSSYLSRNDPRMLIGLGPDAGPAAVTVRWPSGRTETWPDVPADTYWELSEGDAPARAEARPRGR